MGITLNSGPLAPKELILSRTRPPVPIKRMMNMVGKGLAAVGVGKMS